MDPQTYVSLDLETTGINPQAEEIIEVAAVKFQGQEVVGTWHSMVNPCRPIPPYIQVLTGITSQMVEGAPTFPSLAGPLVAFIRDHPLVGHRVAFDLGFLSAKGLGLSNPCFDTWEMASILLPSLPNHQLSTLAAHLGTPNPTPHRALADALATKDVFLGLAKRAQALDWELLQEMASLLSQAGLPLGGLLQDVASKKLASALVRHPPTAMAKLGPLPEPLVRRSARVAVGEEEVEDLLGQGGAFSQTFPGYEERPQQRAMARVVARALNRGGQLMVEAGTGVGKSLAYLLPSVLFAVRNGTPLVISTNTINLQEQLMGKDIPALRRVLEEVGQGPDLAGFRAALLKGRGNYLCWRRWNLLRQSPQPSPLEARFRARLLVWLTSTTAGDAGELNLPQEEASLWRRVCIQAEDCAPSLCPYHQRDQCFLYRARDRARGAHLILVNHALLLSDLSVRTAQASEGRVLPEYQHLVIDEAHHLEEEATAHLGFKVGPGDFLDYLDQLLEARPGGRRTGLLPQMEAQLRQKPAQRAEALALIEGLASKVMAFPPLVEDFFRQVASLVAQLSPEGGDYDRRLRLTRSVQRQPAWLALLKAWDLLSRSLWALEEDLGRLCAILENEGDLVQELAALRQGLGELRRRTGALTSEPPGDAIHWAALDGRARLPGRQAEACLCSAPLHVGKTLQEELFSVKECVILTSATLSTEGTFEFLKERLGLRPRAEIILGSPFDYKNSTLLWLPQDMPDPGQAGYQARVEEVLVELLSATQGRALLLFTSYGALRATLEAIRPRLEQEGLLVLGHGVDGSRSQLLETFQRSGKAVLLGTASFWEGVDVVGQALSVLVMARLPFNVPTDPIFAARAETFEDSFGQYALPLSILRFRQGFGRLIRSRTDRGVIVVLDSRLHTKSYGRAFLQSLPTCTVRTGPVRDLPRDASRWLLSFQANFL